MIEMSFGLIPYGLGQNPYPYYTRFPWTPRWESNLGFTQVTPPTNPYNMAKTGFPLYRSYAPHIYQTPYQYPYQPYTQQALTYQPTPYPIPYLNYTSKTGYQQPYNLLYVPQYQYYAPQNYQQPYQQQIPPYPPTEYVSQHFYYAQQYGYPDP